VGSKSPVSDGSLSLTRRGIIPPPNVSLHQKYLRFCRWGVSSMPRSLLLSLATLLALTGLSRRGDEPAQPPPKGKGFTDITKEAGVADLVARQYGKNPKWWLSGLHLVDLDGDGKLDLFLSAHGGGSALAALNDGAGRFALAPGNYPPTEIHLAYDLDEDGKVDLTMTFQDGGGKWWLNRSKPGTLAFEGTKI